MADKWIPVRKKLPENGDDNWKIVMTQDGTIYPAVFKNNQWSPMFRGGLVEQLFHGRVAFWQDTPIGYPNVQCACGRFFLQTDGQQTCEICKSFAPPTAEVKQKKPRKKAEEVAEEVGEEESNDLDSLE